MTFIIALTFFVMFRYIVTLEKELKDQRKEFDDMKELIYKSAEWFNALEEGSIK